MLCTLSDLGDMAYDTEAHRREDVRSCRPLPCDWPTPDFDASPHPDKAVRGYDHSPTSSHERADGALFHGSTEPSFDGHSFHISCANFMIG